MERLTARELEVLDPVTRPGGSTKAAAAELFLAEGVGCQHVERARSQDRDIGAHFTLE